MKVLKIISLLQFLTQISQKFGPYYPSNVAVPAIFALNFHSGICKNTTLCFKRYSPCKLWKKPIDNASFFTFLMTLDGPNLAKILSQDHTHFFFFFAGFQWNMLEQGHIQSKFHAGWPVWAPKKMYPKNKKLNYWD